MEHIIKLIGIGYGTAGFFAVLLHMLQEWKTRDAHISAWVRYPLVFICCLAYLNEFAHSKDKE